MRDKKVIRATKSRVAKRNLMHLVNASISLLPISISGGVALMLITFESLARYALRKQSAKSYQKECMR